MNTTTAKNLIIFIKKDQSNSALKTLLTSFIKSRQFQKISQVNEVCMVRLARMSRQDCLYTALICAGFICSFLPLLDALMASRPL